MFARLKRYTLDNTNLKNIGRRFVLQERIKLGNRPLYQITIEKNGKLEKRVNLSEVELISLYFIWNHKSIREVCNGRKRYSRRENGFELEKFEHDLWKTKVEIDFTKEEENYFLTLVEENLNAGKIH